MQRVLAALGEGTVANAPLIDVAMKARGWTRTQMAAELGINRTHMTHVLTGKALLTADVRLKLWALFPEFEPEELFIPADSTDTGSAA